MYRDPLKTSGLVAAQAPGREQHFLNDNKPVEPRRPLRTPEPADLDETRAARNALRARARARAS
jgi:hypothetical protein